MSLDRLYPNIKDAYERKIKEKDKMIEKRNIFIKEKQLDKEFKSYGKPTPKHNINHDLSR